MRGDSGEVAGTGQRTAGCTLSQASLGDIVRAVAESLLSAWAPPSNRATSALALGRLLQPHARGFPGVRQPRPARRQPASLGARQG